MGFGDLIRNATNKATETVKSEIEKQVDSIRTYPERQAELRKQQAEQQAEIRKHMAEQEKMQRVMFQISSGFQKVNASANTTMFQRQDGTVYFNTNFNDRFLFIDYIWNGPQYEIITNSMTNATGQEVTKGKGGKIVAGAVIGSAFGPAGTLVGAAAGSAGKKKKNKSSQSNTSSIQRQTEILTPATLKFRNMETNDIVSIVIGCNSLIDSQIKGMQIIREQSVNEISKDTTDALKGIKALKELLDMGAITREEFDSKKQQLLNR